jgi:hypothetical protein
MQAVAQTPEDDRRIAEELSINNSRPVLLRQLAPKIMPDCQIQASEQEITDFFAYWRDMAKQIQRYRKDHGFPDADAPPRPQMGEYKIVPQVPLVEMAEINASVPKAVDRARGEIEIWHIYGCIAREFRASQFSAHYGFFGAPWPEPLPATLAFEQGDERSMMIPDMAALEPLDALGRFFRQAKSQGLMGFTDPNHEGYFFYRYESSYFVNLKKSDATDRWFDAPPWQHPKPAP